MKKISNRNILLNNFEQQLVIAEIGVFKGDYSKVIYNTLKPKELHLIDLFDGQHPSGDKDGKNIVWANLNEEYNKLKSWSNENKNILLHKGKSYEILDKFENDYFDIIYIDGDHSYEGVKKDLNVSWKKIKNMGYITGHDYTPIFQGVIDAVNEFCNIYNQNISILTEDGCPSFVIQINKK